MVRLSGRESQTGADVLPLEIGKVGEYFGLAHTGCKKIEDVLNPDPHSADAWATAALVRVEGNAIHERKSNHRTADSKGSGGFSDSTPDVGDGEIRQTGLRNHPYKLNRRRLAPHGRAAGRVCDRNGGGPVVRLRIYSSWIASLQRASTRRSTAVWTSSASIAFCWAYIFFFLQRQGRARAFERCVCDPDADVLPSPTSIYSTIWRI